VVGHWQDEDVSRRSMTGPGPLARPPIPQAQDARFGGMNMREVAVTGGDRLEAQIKFVCR